MTDEETSEEVQEIDLQGLVGGILDERGFTAERSQRLELLDGLEDRLLSAFKDSGGSNPSAPQSAASFDEPGFLAKVDALIEQKLTGKISSAPPASKESKAGWLGRWLGL